MYCWLGTARGILLCNIIDLCLLEYVTCSSIHCRVGVFTLNIVVKMYIILVFQCHHHHSSILYNSINTILQDTKNYF